MFHHKIVYFFIIDLFYAYMHALLEFQVSEHLNAPLGGPNILCLMAD